MITLEEIKNISFRKGTLKDGFKVEDVNAFIDEVVAAFEQLKKEKTNLVHKIDVLATRIEQYRSEEETVRNALLASQKVSDACIREAKETAAKIVREAETKAQSLKIEANKMTAFEKENYLQLQADAVALRTELIELYKTHIKAINELPTNADYEATKAELNKKYPTEELTDENQNLQTQEELQINSESLEPEDIVSDSNNAPEQEISQSVPQKKTSKFAHLKFGENYDVSAE